MKISMGQFRQLFGFTRHEYNLIVGVGAEEGHYEPDFWESGLHITAKSKELNHFEVMLDTSKLGDNGCLGKIWFGEDCFALDKDEFFGFHLNLQPGSIQITRKQLALLTFEYRREADIEGRLISMLRDHRVDYCEYAIQIRRSGDAFEFKGVSTASALFSTMYGTDGNEFLIYSCAMIWGSDKNRPKRLIDTFHSDERVSEVDKLLE